ncbi:MAG: tripartite tricarboxylate transporter substrate binding protein, partial [Comamonadaceae bacterium]
HRQRTQAAGLDQRERDGDSLDRVVHLAGALLNNVAGMQTLHVPFKGSPAALTALVGGQVDYTIEGISVALPLIKAGRLRPLAVTSQQRNAVLPDVPGMAELGFKDVDVSSWGAYFAPAGTPPEVVQKLNAALGRALTDPDVSKRLLEMSFTPAPGTPAAVTVATQRELARWPAVVQATGAKVD